MKATLCQTRDKQPLATLHGLPGDGADMTPAQLRALAAMLSRIADDAEEQPMTGRAYRSRVREYDAPKGGAE